MKNTEKEKKDEELYQACLRILQLIRGKPYRPVYAFSADDKSLDTFGSPAKIAYSVYINPDSFTVLAEPNIQQQLMMLDLVWREITAVDPNKETIGLWNLSDEYAYEFFRILLRAIIKEEHNSLYSFHLPSGIFHVKFKPKVCTLLYEPPLERQFTLLRKIWNRMVPPPKNDEGSKAAGHRPPSD